MADLQRKKDILHQLVKARNAVKRKYQLLKFGKENFDKAIGETFKPIVDPLEKLVSVTTKEHVLPKKAVEKEEEKNSNESFHKEEDDDDLTTNSEDETLLNETVREAEEESAFETAASGDENPADEYMLLLNQSKSMQLDKIYGVRKEDGKYMLGDTSIIFGEKIKVKGVPYPKTEGLLELMIMKQPDGKFITQQDMENYRKILEQTNAHKRRWKKDEVIRASNSKKYTNIIAPMFLKKKGGSLPRYKVARKNMRMDYVYWDDPNELVDRLRLLLAERAAGNHSHTNEIRSIIEELREAGYIY